MQLTILMRLKFQYFEQPEMKLYALVGLILLFLVTKEAIILPLTHDEDNTIYCSTTPVWDIITYKDPVPNNHILNTLLIKLNNAVFGDHLFAFRLHNVLSFVLYFMFSVLIARALFKEIWLQCTLLVIFLLQPYILDFFSVTRGYGLALAFEVMSLYYFIERWKTGAFHNLLYCLIWAAVGVYANFTMLNYFIPLCGFLIYDIFKRIDNDDKSKFYKELLSVIITSFILTLLIIIPIYRMVSTKQLVYWGINGFYKDTICSLIVSLRSGVDYFAASNEHIQKLVVGVFLIILFAGILIYILHQKSKFYMVLLAMLVSVILFNQALFYLMGIPFVNARTALFFVPLFVITFVLSVEHIFKKNQQIGLAVIIMINALFVQHFIRGYKVDSNFEWSYDQNTFKVLDHLKDLIQQAQLTKPVQVNCYWIFYPSMNYHAKKQYSEYIEMKPWNTKIQNDSTSIFYYTESSEKDQLMPRFDIIKDYNHGAQLLMKAKGK